MRQTYMFLLAELFPRPCPPDPEIGDTLRLPDFLTDIDPGPRGAVLGACWSGHSFWMAMCLAPGGICRSLGLYRIGRVLLLTVDRGPENRPRSVKGHCQDGMRGTPLQTNIRGLIRMELGYNYVAAIMIGRRGMKYIGRCRMY